MHVFIYFILFSDKEEAGDEEGDNGNVARWAINTCCEPPGSTNASWCHLSSKIEFYIRSSSLFP